MLIYFGSLYICEDFSVARHRESFADYVDVGSEPTDETLTGDATNRWCVSS